MPQDSKGEVFVRIPDQLDLRTNLLESAKLTTYLLKKYERLTQINKQKKKEVFKIKLLFSEASSMMNTLEFKDVSWFGSAHQENTEKVKAVKKVEKLSTQKDKLTQDLEEIERKLNSLKF